jgi:hypothetical protein
VFLILPGFEVRGNMRMSSRLDLRTVLTTGTDTFVPVFEGQMRSSLRRDFSFSTGGMLVNKNHVEAFWLEEES